MSNAPPPHGTPPPLPTDPLPYATPGAGIGGRALAGAAGVARVFHLGMFLWSLALVVIWMLILIFVLPKLQEIYQDFKIELPFTTKVLIAVQNGVMYGGFVLLLLIPVVLGFVSGPLAPGARRALRMVLTLVFGLVVGLTVLGIFQPLMVLMGR